MNFVGQTHPGQFIHIWQWNLISIKGHLNKLSSFRCNRLYYCVDSSTLDLIAAQIQVGKMDVSTQVQLQAQPYLYKKYNSCLDTAWKVSTDRIQERLPRLLLLHPRQ